MGIRLLGLRKGASQFGGGVEWEANFGHAIPFLQIDGSSPEHSIVLGVSAGVFGRFALETTKRDLISSDWVFAMPLYWRNDEHWVQLSYRHISSHLGDDYMLRFDQFSEGYMRDDVGITVFRRLGDWVGMYAGGNYAFNVDPDANRRGALTIGLEINRPVQTPWYSGIDVYSDQDASWEPRFNLHVGRRTEFDDGRGIRVTFEMLLGPSPQGEFRRGDVFLVATGIAIEL
jgi:hypothetical protein